MSSLRHARVISTILCATSVSLCLCGSTAVAGNAQGKPAPVSYKKQIAPILAASCNACHSVASPQSRLTTVSYAALMKGGARGRALIPGDPQKSLIVEYIEGRKQPKISVGD